MILGDVASERAGVLLEGTEGVSTSRSIDCSDHTSFTVGGRDKLLAEEPDRLGIVSDGQVPLGNRGLVGTWKEDPAGIEATVRIRLAWVSEV